MSKRKSLFSKPENTQAFLKAGLMGFAGDGKTYTATRIAIGLVELMRQRELPLGDKPAMFIDTETGSDWVKPWFDEAEIELLTVKTRAFRDLLGAITEAEQNGSVLIIDSITHFWRDLTESYVAKKRKNYLEFQDWATLKTTWGHFTDAFVNSQCHVLLCGRAGFEYDFFERDDGKKELQKTGVKMKAETETGYEPSILILMEKHRDMTSKEIWRTATILKDRSTRLDGKEFKNPTFEDFLPHIEFLNLGGKQLGVDTTRDSKEMFDFEGRPEWKVKKEQKEICLDEIQAVLLKHFPSTGKDDKAKKGDYLEAVFGTRSWKRIEEAKLDQLQQGRNELWVELEGHEYQIGHPEEAAEPKLVHAAE